MTSSYMENLRDHLPKLNPALLNEVIEHSLIKEFPKNTEILREEQYVKVIPIVIKGLVKVFSTFEERELLLYYIEPKQSCIMSFNAALANRPSKVFAITEEDSEILLIPVDKLSGWLSRYPDFNQLFFHHYDLRYTELLDTIQHLLVNKMDKRILDYLEHKANLKNSSAIKISHGQIANDLGTAREVISRIIKKLEIEGRLTQNSGEITLH